MAVETAVILVLSLVPTAVIAVMATIEMKPASNAYSMRSWPSVSLTKRASRFFMCLFLCVGLLIVAQRTLVAADAVFTDVAVNPGSAAGWWRLTACRTYEQAWCPALLGTWAVEVILYKSCRTLVLDVRDHRNECSKAALKVTLITDYSPRMSYYVHF
jgi:hypothetical protein